MRSMVSFWRWRLIGRMVRREIIRYLAFNLFFAISLSLGLVGLIIINSLQDSVRLYLESHLRHNLGGDMTISSREPFTQEQQSIINMSGDKLSQMTQKVEFFSMLNSTQESRLVEMIAIDREFPLYGDLSLVDGESIASVLGQRPIVSHHKILADHENPLPFVWMLPDVRRSLGLKLGDRVSVADKPYQVGEDISPKSSAVGLAFSFAPSIYVRIDALDYDDLNVRGSRVSYQQIYRVKANENVQAVADKVRTDLEKLGKNTTKLSVRTYLSSNRQLSDLLTKSSHYLSMFALIALFLSGIGTIYLYRTHLSQRLIAMAIMNSLGMGKREVIAIYAVQSLVLGLFATFIALLLAVVLLPIFDHLLSVFKMANFSIGLTIKSTLLAFLIGTIGGLTFCYPVIAQLNQASTQNLLNAGSELENQQRSWKKHLFYLPTLLFIFLVSVYQTSFISGGFFLLVFTSALLLLGLIATLLIKLGQLISTSNRLYIKIALRNIVRHRWSSIITFSVFGLGAFLLTILPQIYQGLQNVIDASDKYSVPSLFLFDIQPDQIKPLQQLIAKQGRGLLSITPMVRARLNNIDGQTPRPRNIENRDTLSRNETPNQRNRHLYRHVNITYRAHTLNTENIYQGQALSPKYNGTGDKDNPIQVSIENRFAKRMAIRLNSLLEFSVQGVSIYARVVNFRQVKWNSFNPNFFIVMQPGLLEEAPQTYLATVDKATIEQRIQLQNKIVSRFSNVSVIDITALVQQLIDLSHRITLAVTVIAIFTLLVGLMVIYSISHAGIRQKRVEMNLLKVLGCRQKHIYGIFAIEFSFIHITASLFGIVMSVLATMLFSHYLFETTWHLDISTLITVFLLLNFSAICLTGISAGHILKQKAQLQN